MDLTTLRSLSQRLKAEVTSVVHGQESALRLLLTAILAEGHVLLEGVPGTAKTLLARAFARALGLQFRRAQFTPDLMPSDLLGVRIFDFKSQQFVLTKGPIFTDVLLADELNRTPPKTQAALLEAMAERRVSIAEVTHELGDGFVVIATQNPVEMEGTYPLPEAQLDRFLFRLIIDYPDRDAEARIVDEGALRRGATDPLAGLKPAITLAELRAARELVSRVHLAPPVRDYLLAIVRRTREHEALRLGASPRAAVMLAFAAKAFSALEGQDFVAPDAIQELAVPALAHRLALQARHELEGQTAAEVLGSILAEVPVPR